LAVPPAIDADSVSAEGHGEQRADDGETTSSKASIRRNQLVKGDSQRPPSPPHRSDRAAEALQHASGVHSISSVSPHRDTCLLLPRCRLSENLVSTFEAVLVKPGEIFPLLFRNGQRRKLRQPQQVVDPGRHVVHRLDDTSLERLFESEVCEEERMAELSLRDEDRRGLVVLFGRFGRVLELSLDIHRAHSLYAGGQTPRRASSTTPSR
jgi:hypothetical protein